MGKQTCECAVDLLDVVLVDVSHRNLPKLTRDIPVEHHRRELQSLEEAWVERRGSGRRRE